MCEPNFDLEVAKEIFDLLKGMGDLAIKFQTDSRVCEEGETNFLLFSMGTMSLLKDLTRHYISKIENENERKILQKDVTDFLATGRQRANQDTIESLLKHLRN